jgi:hypothetical protein
LTESTLPGAFSIGTKKIHSPSYLTDVTVPSITKVRSVLVQPIPKNINTKKKNMCIFIFYIFGVIVKPKIKVYNQLNQ